jgi:hypothetical protein
VRKTQKAAFKIVINLMMINLFQRMILTRFVNFIPGSWVGILKASYDEKYCLNCETRLKDMITFMTRDPALKMMVGSLTNNLVFFTNNSTVTV